MIAHARDRSKRIPSAAKRTRVPDFELILRFALFIARPGSDAMLIDESNRCVGWVPIIEAVRSGRAFAVEVAHDVLAVDQDDRHLARALDRLFGELVAAGYTPVLAASGSEGHRHLFVRVTDRARWIARARCLGFKGDAIRIGTNRIRPPLSPHRLGGRSTLLRPTDPTAALIALAPRRPRLRRLSRRIYTLLKHGDRQGRYNSRSEVLEATMLGAINKDWSPDAIYQALIDPHNEGGAKLRERLEQEGERESERYFDVVYRKALERYRESPPTHEGARRARGLISCLREVAARQSSPSISGASDYAVLVGHLEIADAVGDLTYTAGTRQVAERAEVSVRTVHRAHKRLRKARWLHVEKRGEGREATTWRLGLGHESTALFRAVAKHRGKRLEVRSDVGADAFRWRALGKSTWRVYDAVKRLGSASTDKLITALGMRQRMVRYHLRKLLAVKLLRSGPHGFQCNEAEAPRVAAKLGTLGMGAVQQAHHEQERRAYRHRRLRAAILGLASAHGWPTLSVPPKVVIADGEQTWRAFVLQANQEILVRVLRALLRRGRRTARNGTDQSRAGQAEQ